MSTPLRTANSGTFFITAITADRRRIFQKGANARLFIDTLQHYRHEGLHKLHAFVVMPDHVHLLITTEDLARAMKHIRGGFSFRLHSPYEVWQKGYADHMVQSRAEFDTRKEYIHQNPVRAKLTQNPPKGTYFPRPFAAKAAKGMRWNSPAGHLKMAPSDTLCNTERLTPRIQ